MSWFALASLAAAVVVVLVALRFRGRPYAVFGAVLVSVQTLVGSAMFAASGPVAPLFAYLHASVYVHLLSLVRPAMRPRWWRALVSLPASYFWAASVLALPWATLRLMGFEPWLPWLPYAVALVGLWQSTHVSESVVDVTLDGRDAGPVPRRHPRGAPGRGRPLRLVQISDPHLGPFMSTRRLRRLCERAVAWDPDLVLLTGDFLTMESQRDPNVLGEALAPLRALEGRTFACHGNHDHEAPRVVAAALASAGVRLLIDEEARVDTGAGPVAILGFEFHWRGRRERMAEVCARWPRRPGIPRVALLHDPGAFRHLPAGAADLTLSGHTHGGQVGLVSLGAQWTFVGRYMPDHGFWARGRERLYVHRGTGHYGFPLRLGVPAEHGLLRVHFQESP